LRIHSTATGCATHNGRLADAHANRPPLHHGKLIVVATGGVSTETWLVADMGATNARFGLVSPQRLVLHTRTLPIADHPTIADAITGYWAERGDLPVPGEGGIAIASAITGDRVAMTTHPWSFSISALREEFGLARLEVINDFTALALALPYLSPQERQPIGGG